jgi:hypothetical protein
MNATTKRIEIVLRADVEIPKYWPHSASSFFLSKILEPALKDNRVFHYEIPSDYIRIEDDYEFPLE